MTNKIKAEQLKKENLNKAFTFAKELISFKTPKKTAVISIMGQNNLNVRDARKVYADAKKSSDGHKNRH